MPEPMTGCNRFFQSNLCVVCWSFMAFIVGIGIWFGPIYLDESEEQTLLTQSFAAHVEGSRDDQADIDKKLDSILQGQGALQRDMSVVKDRLDINQ